MTSRLLLLIAAMVSVPAISSCAAIASAEREHAMTVAESIRKFRTLESQVIEIRGWMAECTREMCGLFATAKEARKGVITGWAHMVRPDQGFLDQLPNQAVRKVVLRARVVVTCRNDGLRICLERSGYLHPIDVKAAP